MSAFLAHRPDHAPGGWRRLGAADPSVVYYYTSDSADPKFTRHEVAGPDEHIAFGSALMNEGVE